MGIVMDTTEFTARLDKLHARARETADELVADPLNMEKMKIALAAAHAESDFLRENKPEQTYG
jgi:hypothetical protein